MDMMRNLDPNFALQVRSSATHPSLDRQRFGFSIKYLRRSMNDPALCNRSAPWSLAKISKFV